VADGGVTPGQGTPPIDCVVWASKLVTPNTAQEPKGAVPLERPVRWPGTSATTLVVELAERVHATANSAARRGRAYQAEELEPAILVTDDSGEGVANPPEQPGEEIAAARGVKRLYSTSPVRPAM